MFERILNILLVLALGLLLGATIFFGLGVAGVLFNPELLSSRTISGSLNARVLERLMVLMTAGSIVALGSSVPLMFSKPRRTNIPTFVSLVLLAGLALYLSLDLFPTIDELRVAIGSFDPVLAAKQDLYARFTDLHGRFSMLAKVGFGLGLIALISHLLSLVSRARRVAPEEQFPGGEEPDAPALAEVQAESGDAESKGGRKTVAVPVDPESEQESVEESEEPAEGEGRPPGEG